ncbi:MAG: nucleoside triphosphate pyrophosphohydrolase [Thermotoga sp. 4484_232]|nr:MAG: nucleoside triphosphate pyrophosphohydrolase [Thermotoga sp. 4484_232]RKX53566.1 MAG: nucleoside triphosphate pyrophosphohydrolase [Thermotoga sp.]RKX57156.1 MAG: nucleoside triphosphate pyrophosphohydrolase [Thermotoga sp.]HDG61725.1 nucleoside triphosphate pyrophosphohydrolase [Thermotoga sp.]
MEEVGRSFEKLVNIMKRLRGPGGCDWDRAQTHESLKPYIIEEAYELLNAIESGDTEELKEELGDVLLQVVFHSQIASERGAFDISDVVETLCEKLIRRHPHVFGKSGRYSYKQWEDIKAREKSKKSVSRIGDLNPALPALSMARRIQENASAVGFDWENIEEVFEKVLEELEELKRSLSNGDRKRISEELGDLLFSVVNLSRFLNVDPESALRKATERFWRRFRRMEEMIEKDGLKFEDLSIEELDRYWEKVKGGDLK